MMEYLNGSRRYLQNNPYGAVDRILYSSSKVLGSNLHLTVETHPGGGNGKPTLEDLTYFENSVIVPMSQKQIDCT